MFVASRYGCSACSANIFSVKTFSDCHTFSASGVHVFGTVGDFIFESKCDVSDLRKSREKETGWKLYLLKIDLSPWRKYNFEYPPPQFVNSCACVYTEKMDICVCGNLMYRQMHCVSRVRGRRGRLLQFRIPGQWKIFIKFGCIIRGVQSHYYNI